MVVGLDFQVFFPMGLTLPCSYIVSPWIPANCNDSCWMVPSWWTTRLSNSFSTIQGRFPETSLSFIFWMSRCSCHQICSTWHLVTDSTNHCCMWSCHPIFKAWRLAMNSLLASRMWSCPGICGSWRLVEGTINLLNVLCCQRCLKS